MNYAVVQTGEGFCGWKDHKIIWSGELYDW